MTGDYNRRNLFFPMVGRYLVVGLIAGAFLAGVGIGYAVFSNTYSPYSMMYQNPQMFNQMFARNPQFANQYMGYMVQDPQLREQMYGFMLQNKDFMYGMMQNPDFQNQYMGPWMMQNNFTYHGMMWRR